MADQTTPVQATAQQRIHELLSELVEVVGPAGFGEDEAQVSPGTVVFPSEWVIVVNWLDAETGDNYLTRFGSAHLQTHNRAGLLHEGLYGFAD